MKVLIEMLVFPKNWKRFQIARRATLNMEINANSRPYCGA